jgi:NAD(P)-dependent dehydrogenase (short-subunit alcohol dehydrogenase family)
VLLTGSVAVVTGASSGIGRATAWALARRGSAVAVAARREDRLEALVDGIHRWGGRALAVRCDVTHWREVASLRDRVMEVFGRCDILVNNAGIPGGGPFAESPVGQIQRVIATNYLGVIYGAKAFLPPMLAAGRGHIVNVASLAGRFPVPGSAVYSSTKHAVVGFSESLNFEVAPRGVLVTAVNPGLVATEGFPYLAGRRGFVRVMRPEAVARLIVEVVRDGRAPEASIPRGLAALQAVRLLAPPVYRFGMRRLAEMRRRVPRVDDLDGR